MAGSEFYDHTTYPSQGAAGSSAAMRSELELVEAGFGKLPDLAGNGGKITAVNAGGTALEAITTTGTGSGVRATSPTLVTPVLGVATLTSANKVAITAPATAATLALAEGSTLATSGAFSQTLTATAATNVTLPTTGTLATLAGAETLTNKTLTSPAISAPTGITATNISNTPAGGITETTVQGAINGLDAEKAKAGANSDITSLTGLTTALSQAQGGTGTALATRPIAQTQVTQFTAPAAGTTTIPFDNTKPQINEGDQYASLAFTAKNTASTLLIEALVNVSHSATTAVLIGAVFDTLAGVPGDAAGVGITQNVNNGGVNQLLVRFEIVATSLAARTFTLRVGSNTAGTTYVNQSSSSLAIFNGTLVSSLRVTEYLP